MNRVIVTKELVKLSFGMVTKIRFVKYLFSFSRCEEDTLLRSYEKTGFNGKWVLNNIIALPKKGTPTQDLVGCIKNFKNSNVIQDETF